MKVKIDAEIRVFLRQARTSGMAHHEDTMPPRTLSQPHSQRKTIEAHSRKPKTHSPKPAKPHATPPTAQWAMKRHPIKATLPEHTTQSATLPPMLTKQERTDWAASWRFWDGTEQRRSRKLHWENSTPHTMSWSEIHGTCGASARKSPNRTTKAQEMQLEAQRKP